MALSLEDCEYLVLIFQDVDNGCLSCVRRAFEAALKAFSEAPWKEALEGVPVRDYEADDWDGDYAKSIDEGTKKKMLEMCGGK